MQLTFHGAARSVTGSRHLLTIGRRRVLLDCGLYQGRRAESYQRNLIFPFDPRGVDAVVLSHAHIDHSGNLPNLVRQGFAGKVHATHATSDLGPLMLLDCAHILEQDVAYLNRRGGATGRQIEPLYRVRDAQLCGDRFVAHSYGEEFPVVPGVTATFLEAGHIMGAAITTLQVGARTVVFSGDLGHRRPLLLRPRQDVRAAHVLIIESTYGNRRADPAKHLELELVALLTRIHDRGGKLIIPAFAVGRSQTIAYLIKELYEDGRVPPMPVYFDSPLTRQTTTACMRHRDCFRAEIFVDEGVPDDDPFGLRFFRYTESVDESKALNAHGGPAIIVSASGMCEAGRILHHLKNHLPDPRNAVLFVGYQAEGTLGRRILEKAERVRILGEDVERRAEVVVMNAFSAHAHRDELLSWVAALTSPPEHIFVVHGEASQSLPFAEALRELWPTSRVVVPQLDETFNV